MAVLPNKFAPSGGSDKERIAALERYIKYLEERIELYASTTGKKIADIEKKINGGAKNVEQQKEQA